MKKDIVKKSNSLTEAYYSLSVVEYRVLHMAFSALAEFDVNADFYKKVRFTIRADDYMELYGVDRATAYQALKEASERLFNRYFTYDEIVDERTGLVERIKSRWVQKIGYIEKNACVTMYLTSDVLSMVGQLKNQFTYYQLSMMSDLSSIHAIRIYEMMMQWRSTKVVPSISTEELRAKLGLAEDEYPRMFDFKKRVLDHAVNTINEHTNITVSYEQQKSGRNITGFIFKFKEKKTKENKVAGRDSNTVDMFYSMTESQLDTFSSKLSELAEVQAMANVGEDMKPFVARLRLMLKDPEKQKELQSYLKQVGFSTKGSKS
jgi:plasmid replication initiation protein